MKPDTLSALESMCHPEPNTGCWLWLGALDRYGYGQVSHGGRPLRVHRVAYELKHGPIPPRDGYHGACVLHGCDNRSCCNPEHLSLGSAKANTRDMVAKRRHHFGARNGNAKLTEEEARAILERALLGDSPAAIADDFSVSRRAVVLIAEGKRWAHLSA